MMHVYKADTPFSRDKYLLISAYLDAGIPSQARSSELGSPGSFERIMGSHRRYNPKLLPLYVLMDPL